MEENNSQSTAFKSNTGLIAAIIALIVLLGLGFMYFKGAKNKSTSSDDNMMKKEGTAKSTAEMSPTETANAMKSDSDKGEQVIEMEAGSFYFKPNVIKVKKGDKVKVVLHSVSMVHNFNIDELGVKGEMTKNGDTSTTEFTADKVGEFEFYCAIGQHRKMGQVGKITVE